MLIKVLTSLSESSASVLELQSKLYQLIFIFIVTKMFGCLMVAYWWWVEIHCIQSWFFFSRRENQTWWLFHCHLPQQNIYHVHESISSMILSVWWCIRSRYVVLCYYIFTSPGKLSAFNLIGEYLEFIYDFIYLSLTFYIKIYIIICDII